MLFFYPASRGIIFFYPAIPQSQGYTFMSFIFRECVKCRRYLHGCLQEKEEEDINEEEEEEEDINEEEARS